MRDLFCRWPRLAEVLACEEIAELPTPIIPLPAIHPDRAWMKCDDVAHRVYGGNKIRKLELIIPELKRRRIQRVITLGGSGSNSGSRWPWCAAISAFPAASTFSSSTRPKPFEPTRR